MVGTLGPHRRRSRLVDCLLPHFLGVVSEAVAGQAVDPIQRGLLINQVAHVVRLERNEVERMLRGMRPRSVTATPRGVALGVKVSQPTSSIAAVPNGVTVVNDPARRAWDRVLEVLLNEPGLLTVVGALPDLSGIADDRDRRIAGIVLELNETLGEFRLNDVLARCQDPADADTRAGAMRGAPGVAVYLELTKARRSLLVLMTTAVGFWLGMETIEQLPLIIPVCVGTALVVGGANALNQWMERAEDALMQRTRNRPLPSGRLAPAVACRFGLGLSVAGFVVLGLMVNLLTVGIAAVGWISYVFIYTPLKRRTPLCTLVGAIPGAVPPMIGWAAARNGLDVSAWALFFLLFVWQLPHFLSLAVLHREDYARAGFPMLPLVETDGWITARQIALYSLALLPISLFPTLVGLAGTVYFYGALTMSLAFLVVAARAAWQRSPQSARTLFHASVLYLPLLLGMLAWDRPPL